MHSSVLYVHERYEIKSLPTRCKDLAEEDYELRRERIQAELGFDCRCMSCTADATLYAVNPRVYLEVHIGGRVRSYEATVKHRKFTGQLFATHDTMHCD